MRNRLFRIVLPVLLALILTTSLIACGEPAQSSDPLNREDETKNPSGNATQSDEFGTGGGIVDDDPLTLGALLQYVETGDKSFYQPRVLSAAEQSRLRESVEREGGTIDFAPNGDLTVHGDGGGYFTIFADGSVEGVDADGKPFGFGSYGKEWPDSRLGGIAPRADMPIKMVVEDEESLLIMFDGVTFEQAQQYGALLAASGFEDPSEISLPEQNVYSFSGTAADGTAVEFSFMDLNGTVTCALSVGASGGEDDPGDDDPGYNPYDPGNNPGTQGELPDGFAFLLPDGTGRYSIVDRGTYVSIEASGGSREEALQFAARCEANGFTKLTEADYLTDDGKQVYFAGYLGSSQEIHISYDEAAGTFFVDCLTLSGEGEQNPGQSAGTDSWPSAGLLTKLPKPSFGTGFIVSEDEMSQTAIVTGASESDFVSYCQLVAAAGFNLDAEMETELELYYSALNAEDYTVVIQFAYGQFFIGVGVPE